jgi:hypothetical protein
MLLSLWRHCQITKDTSERVFNCHENIFKDTLTVNCGKITIQHMCSSEYFPTSQLLNTIFISAKFLVPVQVVRCFAARSRQITTPLSQEDNSLVNFNFFACEYKACPTQKLFFEILFLKFLSFV